jgi:hypothetical protein
MSYVPGSLSWEMPLGALRGFAFLRLVLVQRPFFVRFGSLAALKLRVWLRTGTFFGILRLHRPEEVDRLLGRT